ncbi:hypothetical protein BWI17_07680 [Betaproteobacteria bacterium GR16-43]|nr:hypothetical protein BWI17_07680 [Betaproteobacteria bacterium GR16-43]
MAALIIGGMASSIGAVLAVLQLAFALTWVVYVIYLPALATQAGIPKQYVPWILLMDQVIFIACDWAAGVYADRLTATVGRFGPRMAMVTLVSCGAFLAMPLLAPAGSVVIFIALTVLWSATSSALRAPPLVLMGRYATMSQRPWLAGLYLFGLGAAGAMAPYLGMQLKDVDPRIPFIVSSVVVALVTLVLAAVDTGQDPVVPTEGDAIARRVSPWAVGAFALAIVLLAVGEQIHFSVNSAPAYAKLSSALEVPRFMPVFWIGFNLLMLPATLLARRFDAIAIVAGSAIVGTAALYVTATATDMQVLLAAQFVAGGAWGVVLMSAFTAALDIGTTGREGRVTGLLFSMLAVAAFVRIAFTTTVPPAEMKAILMLPLVPVGAWILAALLLAGLAAGPGRRVRPAGR